MFNRDELIPNLKASFDDFDYVVETLPWQEIDLTGIDELWLSLADCIAEEVRSLIELSESPKCRPDTVSIPSYRCYFVGLVEKIIKSIHYHSGLGYTISSTLDGRPYVALIYTYMYNPKKPINGYK